MITTNAPAVNGERQYPIKQTVEKKPASKPRNVAFNVTKLAPITFEKKTVAKIRWPSVFAYKPRILFLKELYLESITL
jgi:hypothetical protein